MFIFVSDHDFVGPLPNSPPPSCLLLQDSEVKCISKVFVDGHRQVLTKEIRVREAIVQSRCISPFQSVPHLRRTPERLQSHSRHRRQRKLSPRIAKGKIRSLTHRTILNYAIKPQPFACSFIETVGLFGTKFLFSDKLME